MKRPSTEGKARHKKRVRREERRTSKHWTEIVDTDEFAKDLAAAAAKQLAKCPSESAEDVLAHLQDATSLYNPLLHAYLVAELKRRMKDQ